MKKTIKILSILLSLIVVFLLPSSALQVYAAETLNEQTLQEAAAVDELINELGRLRLCLLTNEESAENSALAANIQLTLEEQIQLLEDELLTYHVDILDTAEAAELTGEEYSVNATVPSTTSSVKWYSYESTYIYNGTTYHTQRVYAQGLNSSSNLAEINVAYTLYDDKNVAVHEHDSLISIYASKLIGLVPVLGWTPYELLLPSDVVLDGIVSEACSVAYSYIETVCFAYVYPVTAGESSERLSHVSTSISGSASISIAGIENGAAYSYSGISKDFDASATNYASITASIDAYLDGSPFSMYSYITLPIYDEENRLVHTIYPACPALPSGVS